MTGRGLPRNDRARMFVIYVVTAVWVANFVAGLVIPDYELDPLIHGVFSGIVGGALALGKSNNGSDSSSKNDAAGGE